MELLEKPLKKIEFRTLPVKEAQLLPEMHLRTFPFTPHIIGLKNDIMKSIVVKFFTDKVIGPKITAGETFTLKVEMRIIHREVALKNIKVSIVPNFEYVTMEEPLWGMYAFFENFSYSDGWISADLKLKVRVDNIPVEALYDIADITFDADVDYEKLFHFKRKIEDVEVMVQA
jgi:hypothetical protein